MSIVKTNEPIFQLVHSDFFDQPHSWEGFLIRMDMVDPNLRPYYDKSNTFSICAIRIMLEYSMKAFSYWNNDCTPMRAKNIFNCIVSFMLSNYFTRDIARSFDSAYDFMQLLKDYNRYDYGRNSGDTLNCTAHNILDSLIELTSKRISLHSVDTNYKPNIDDEMQSII